MLPRNNVRNVGVGTGSPASAFKRTVGVGTGTPVFAFKRTKYVNPKFLSNYFAHQEEPHSQNSQYEFKETDSYEQNIKNPGVFIRSRIPKNHKKKYSNKMKEGGPMDPGLLYVKYLLDARKPLKAMKRKTMNINPDKPGGIGRIKYGDLKKFLASGNPGYVSKVMEARRGREVVRNPYKALRAKERQEIANKRSERKKKREADIAEAMKEMVKNTALAEADRAEAGRVAKRDKQKKRARPEVDSGVLVQEVMNQVDNLVNNRGDQKRKKANSAVVVPRMTRAARSRAAAANKAAANKAAAKRKAAAKKKVGGTRTTRSGRTTEF